MALPVIPSLQLEATQQSQVPVMERVWYFVSTRNSTYSTISVRGVACLVYFPKVQLCQNKSLDPIHFKQTQPISKVASCSVSIREFCDFTNCWLTDIVISRPTNQAHSVFNGALSSEKKNRSCLVRYEVHKFLQNL
jgi:hypothetical protein